MRHRAVADPAFATRLLGITNLPERSLGRLVDQILDIVAGIELGVAATKKFLGQLQVFYELVRAFAERRGGGGSGHGSDQLSQLAPGLQALPLQLRELVDDLDRCSEQMEHLFAETQDVIIKGRGINYPIALERALKLNEIAYEDLK
jgi:glucosamine--fructose-6-phosphate aminotransferase (isomerizing)